MNHNPQRPFVFVALVSAFSFLNPANSSEIPSGYQLVYEQSFEGPEALKDFVMTDTVAWKQTVTGIDGAMELVQQSQYKPAVRSPVNIALVADKVVGDFILEVDMLQTGKEYGHRDMCLYFGFQEPSKFYYVHIATAADDHAHNVFIVNDEPRTKIAKKTTQGVNWGRDFWYKVRIERKLGDGTIRVFFDDMKKPIMIAEDKTFGPGYVGFGSFDDTGMVDNIRIWAPSVETRKTAFFSRP